MKRKGHVTGSLLFLKEPIHKDQWTLGRLNQMKTMWTNEISKETFRCLKALKMGKRRTGGHKNGFAECKELDKRAFVAGELCICLWMCVFFGSSSSILGNVLCSFMQVKLSHCCSSHSFPLHFPFLSSHYCCSSLPASFFPTRHLKHFWDTLTLALLTSVGFHAILRATKKCQFYSVIFAILTILQNKTKRPKNIKLYFSDAAFNIGIVIIEHIISNSVKNCN